MALIDLRSDTVTLPSAGDAPGMADAELGDDVFGDDPTVNALEERAAELLGKEAGLFVASGTMGNLVAQMAHLGRGQETDRGPRAPPRPRRGGRPRGHRRHQHPGLDDRPDGTLDPAEIEAAFRDPTDPHEPITGLVTIENTHAHSMGQPLTPAYTRQVADIAHAHGVPLHVDGARFWNAVSPRASARPTSPARPTPSRSACRRAWPARSAPSSSGRATSSGARGGPGRWSVAGCARPGSSRRPASSRSATARTA